VMVREFLTTTGLTAQAACFDVAGAVMGGRAELTNLPWTGDAAALCAARDMDKVFLSTT
jgi:glucokinase